MSTGGRCQHCGAEVTHGALFCSKCGAEVTSVFGPGEETLPVTSIGTPAPRIQSTMRQILRDATLGEYEILSELGRGGMATVFLGHDIALDRKVAIKVMAPHLLEGEGMADRFKLEARTAAQLSHPHIIPIYAVKETESTLFFVMKFVEGKPLDDIIKKMGQLPIPMVKDILTKVGSALGYAHRRGVVHRDVKPANVMIDEEGTPIVTDFGIAKVAEAKGLTVTGTTIGTPAYMSPEQCEAKEVTGASDQYSLGVVAWEMLTGSPPFSGDSAVTTMYKHCHEPLPPLKDFRPDSPPEVLETVTRMLAKAPSDRWPSLEAAIRRIGSSAQDQLDPGVRELLELARETPRELLAQLSTPRSPLPGVSTVGRTAHGALGHGAFQTPVPQAPRRSWLPAAAGFVLLAGAAAALAVLQPWSSDTPPAAVGAGVGQGSQAVPPPVGPGDGGAPAAADPAPASDGGSAGGAIPGAAGGSTAVADAPGGGSAGGTSGAEPATSVAAGGPGPTGTGGPATGGAVAPPQPTVSEVQIDGVPGSLEPQERATLSARALTAGGAPVRAGAARWSTSDANVGTVSQDGVFTAVGPGSTTVLAEIGGVTGRATVEVASTRVASLSLDRTELTLTRGERTTLRATPRARSGSTVEAQVTWRSSEPAVATVSSGGEVSAVAPGSARLTASAGSASETVGVTVLMDARTAVEELLAAYASALESGDLTAVRRAYPGMTAEQEQNFRQSLPSIETVSMRLVRLDDQGDAATASVEGTYGFNVNGRRSTSPVSFQATFRRAGTAWEMTRIQ